MELIGPIAAQKKYDAMQSKNFVALDPSEQGKTGHRTRSRSMGSRRGRNQEAKEILLCPCDEQPVKRIYVVSYEHASISVCTVRFSMALDNDLYFRHILC